MPYRIKNTHKGAKPFKVVNEITDEVKGSHATEEDAQDHMAVLYMVEKGNKPTSARKSRRS
jgi:hypothetical protein